MQTELITLNEAKIRLDELLAMAILGNDVIIAKDDGTTFRIVPFAKPYPKFGSAKGLIEISDDFDEPVEGFEEYMP
ncbi:MAG: type II toxin-antitoxin system Phd/YefM family antitoxin [Desulfamplus sp.]